MGDRKEDDSFGGWERSTKGIGSQLLAKWGFSGRLGKDENGIANPIIPKLRPQHAGLGSIDNSPSENPHLPNDFFNNTKSPDANSEPSIDYDLCMAATKREDEWRKRQQKRWALQPLPAGATILPYAPGIFTYMEDGKTIYGCGKTRWTLTHSTATSSTI